MHAAAREIHFGRRSQDRATRRRRANTRVLAPIERPIRDPLARRERGPGRAISRGALILIFGGLVHAVILFGFLAANAISHAFDDEETPEPEKTAVTMLEPPEPEIDRPPPEPEPEPPPPQDAIAPAFAPPAVAAPQIGINADSTIEGGTGPAFRTGASLDGALDPSGLAQEILAKDEKQGGAAEMVMTTDTVDTQPRPLPSNRAPSAPSQAVRKRVSGLVVVRMLIGKDGTVLETKILQSEPAGFFDDSVLEVVPSWRFSPATYHGRPVTLRVDQTIRFNLG